MSRGSDQPVTCGHLFARQLKAAICWWTSKLMMAITRLINIFSFNFFSLRCELSFMWAPTKRKKWGPTWLTSWKKLLRENVMARQEHTSYFSLSFLSFGNCNCRKKRWKMRFHVFLSWRAIIFSSHIFFLLLAANLLQEDANNYKKKNVRKYENLLCPWRALGYWATNIILTVRNLLTVNG